ncbi:transposase [Aminobacter sp. DSM 101952]|uniref:IS66 family insertion sequence element accessory protein TnpA n=1 Tax=unclassified Aminobacter TaxID=2644704 RepID=UPI0006FD7F19|nr:MULTISPECIES: transposase [unclassified Aminobacter]AWC23636.1 IS2 repressor TnpA [Aminobacter sp. MSH1]KQU76065.1 transposase [Aminobacter sp. DSM 101952]
MASRRSWEKAHSPYWSLHVEAWRQSGLSRTEYCRQHCLTKATFGRWMKHLVSKEDARKHAEYQAELRRQRHREEREKGIRKRQRRHFAVSTDVRSKAVQAFWAMHVEAMNWSGMGVREYAAALQLSPYSLRRWRDRFEDGEVEIDWREHLHPSARPRISTGASSAAKEGSVKSGLTDTPNTDPPRDARTNRRSFTDGEKLAIVLETEQPGIAVAEVCRRHGIVTSMLFRWRVRFGFAQKKRVKLATVAMPASGAGASSVPVVLHDLLPPPDGMSAVELPDGRRVFAPADCDPNAVRAHVARGEIVP